MSLVASFRTARLYKRTRLVWPNAVRVDSSIHAESNGGPGGQETRKQISVGTSIHPRHE